MAGFLRGHIQLRVGTMLAALLVMPTLGLLFLASQQVTASVNAQAELRELQTAAGLMINLIELEANLEDELYWSEAKEHVQSFGIPPVLVNQFLGTDMDQNVMDAQAKVDELLQRLGDEQLTQEVATARTKSVSLTTDLSAPLRDVIKGSIRDATLTAKADVLARASELDSSDSIVRSAQSLIAANTIRASYSDLVIEYLFLLVYGGLDPQQYRAQTQVQLGNYEQSVAAMSELQLPSTEVGAAFEAATQNTAVVIMIESTVATLESEIEPTELTAIPDSDQLLVLFNAFSRSDEASQAFLDLVDTTANELLVQVENKREAQFSKRVRTEALTLLVLAATLIAALTITRSIVRPLKELDKAAEQLRSGEQLESLTVVGPIEVRSATMMLNDAIDHFARAEEQAVALADGRLDDRSLMEPLSGRLGESLDAAVVRLRESMAESEDFRDRMTYEANHDGLTRLSNRRASIRHLGEAIARAEGDGTQVAVFFIDLDSFKAINDLYGHAGGDHLLIEFARRLNKQARPGDVVGRLGGDEFLVVAEQVTSLAQATALAERIKDNVSKLVVYEDHEIYPTVSIGIALADGSSDAATVIREADYAVYEAKKNGRGRFEVFDDNLRAELDRNNELGDSIIQGLANDHFELLFQPIVEASSSEIQVCEALIRWNDPIKGRIFPDEFISFAERSDLIIDIDQWVISQALKEVSQASPESPLRKHGVAVNISGRHLLKGSLFQDVSKCLQKWGVSADQLTIELTESALLDDLDTAAQTLHQLREIGVRISIDDFGTGYTSLAHLRSLPVDELKVDRSFTNNLDNPDDLSLVRLITEAGHTLGLVVTVEGVETQAQQETLVQLGADRLQGYRFGRPVTATDLEAVPTLGSV